MNSYSTYFFIDGSALTSQIRQLRRADASFKDRKLCPKKFIGYFQSSLMHLHAGAYKRVTFYFPVGDETAIEDYILLPDHNKPGEIEDLHFKFCGQKLKKSAEFNEFVETKVPSKFKDRFSKSEKGIDIEICCDAFKLARSSRLDRLFLLTNDDDFIPFFRMIKEFGANISIFHLSDVAQRNVSLLREADTYNVVPMSRLQELFLPPFLGEVLTHDEPEQTPPSSVLKPEAEPSDMVMNKDSGSFLVEGDKDSKEE
jgi:uncharacterized LabA/DUF88 family protein